MKKALIYIFVVITASVVHAQNPTLSPFVISPGGNYASNGGISLSATIGELAAIETFINSPNNIILTQGFQQSNDSIILGLLDIEKGSIGYFCVYPVPCKVVESYGYEFPESGQVEVNLYNISGKKMDYYLNETYFFGKLIHSFDCSSFPSGNYILTIRLTNTFGKQYTLSKNIQFLTK